MSLRDDINKAVEGDSIKGFEFVRLTKWEDILNQIAERFLKRGKRSLNSIWLWEEFREPTSSEHPAEPLATLKDHLDASDYYWFIASDQSGKYWVGDATGEAVVRVVGEMYCFEYYVVDRAMNWILCENHHGVCIRSMASRTTNGEQVRAGNPLHAQ